MLPSQGVDNVCRANIQESLSCGLQKSFNRGQQSLQWQRDPVRAERL